MNGSAYVYTRIYDADPRDFWYPSDYPKWHFLDAPKSHENHQVKFHLLLRRKTENKREFDDGEIEVMSSRKRTLNEQTCFKKYQMLR